jgi:hypothetical protein
VKRFTTQKDRLADALSKAEWALDDAQKAFDAAELAVDEHNETMVDPALYVVHVTNTGNDPFTVVFTVEGEHADDWADMQGALDGGTWETCDDAGHAVYDHGQWSPTLFDDLRKQGYRLDLSCWDDPTEHDMAVGEHMAACDDCREHGDWQRAERHITPRG